MTRLFPVALLLFSAVGVRAEIQFRGLLVADGTAKFSLYESKDQTSRWVSIGQSFAGYEVAEFRTEGEVLVLKNGNELLELSMAAAKILPNEATQRRVGSVASAAEIETAKAKLAAAVERLNALREKSETAKRQLAERDALKAKLAESRKRYGEEHPQVKELARQISELERRSARKGPNETESGR